MQVDAAGEIEDALNRSRDGSDEFNNRHRRVNYWLSSTIEPALILDPVRLKSINAFGGNGVVIVRRE